MDSMKKANAEIEHLFLPRDTILNIRVPSLWKKKIEQDWKAAKKEPGGERFQSLTDYVIARMTPKE